MKILKLILLIFSFIALLFSIYWFTTINITRITSGYNVITTTSIESRNEKVFKRMHMYFNAVNNFTNKLKDENSVPVLHYPKFNPGVNIHLDGYRNKTADDFLIAVHIDRILTNHDWSLLNCAKEHSNTNYSIKCDLPQKPFTITGLQIIEFDNKENPFNLVVKNNKKILWNGTVKNDDIIYSDSFLGCCTGGKIATIIKFKNEKNLIYETYTESDFDNNSKIEIIATNFSGKDLIITGHLNPTKEHYVIDWYPNDHWSYFAVVANTYDEAISIISDKLIK